LLSFQEFPVTQSRIPVRVFNEPGCRHSLAATTKESQLNVQPVNRTFNHNLPGSRFSVASIWSGDISAALPISSASSGLCSRTPALSCLPLFICNWYHFSFTSFNCCGITANLLSADAIEAAKTSAVALANDV